jgi:autotransporter-associated beta strand protein
VEVLESRLNPGFQTLFWLGTANGNFDAGVGAANWATSLSGPATVRLPNSGDTLIFNTNATSFVNRFAITNNVAGLTGLTIQIVDNSAAGDFSITGNALALATSGNQLTSTVTVGAGATLGLNLSLTMPTLPNSLIVTTTGLLTLSGAYTGTSGLIKAGAGTLLLSGTNTYTGTTDIRSGTLQLAGGAAIPDSGAVLVDVGATLDLNNTNETIGSLAGVSAIGGSVTLGSATLTTGGNDTSTVFSGVISGTGGLTKQGTGIFTLSGNNTYTGTTTINQGTLRLSGGNALADTGAVVLANAAGATLDVSNVSETIGSLAGGGSAGGNVTLSSSSTPITLTTGGNSSSTAFGGVISGNGGLTKVGTGTFTLTGANTYSGTTNVNAGVLDVRNNQALGATANGTTVAANATLQFQGGITVAEPITLNGGLLQSVSGANVLTGGLTVPAPSTVRIDSGAGSQLTIQTGNVTLSSTMGPQLTIDAVGNAVINSAISGNGGLTKIGAGLLTLSNNSNSYTGTTTISAGTVLITANNALGSSSAATTVAGGAILQVQGGISVPEAVTLAGTLQNLSGDNTWAGTVGLGSGAVLQVDAGMLTISGQVSGGDLTKTGAGTLTLSNSTNNYTGATSIMAGTLKAGVDLGLSSASAVTVASGATLDLNNFTVTIASLAGAGMVAFLSSGILTTGGNNASTTFSGVLTGGGSGGSFRLIKTGTGTFTLSGNSPSFIGPTSITGGTLLVTGSLANSAVFVFASATLAGTGTVGAVQVNDGNLSPGAGPGMTGILTVNGTVSFSAGARFVVEINGTAAGTGFDQLVVMGTVMAAGTLSATLGFTPAVGASFTLISSTASVTGMFMGLPEGATVTLNGLLFRISYQGNGVTLTRFVPECDPLQVYVTALYINVLERVPDPGGRAFWVGQLRAGESRDRVALSFWLSPEHRGIQVDQLYRRLLNRPPDPAGKQSWVNSLVNGTTTETSLVILFLTSPEYTARHSTNTQYVEGLYRDVLLRRGSPQEVALFVARLDRGEDTRAELALAFLSCDEAYRDAIQSNYVTFLHRTADAAGLQAYFDQIVQGKQVPATLTATFLGSNEFFARAQADCAQGLLPL